MATERAGRKQRSAIPPTNPTAPPTLTRRPTPHSPTNTARKTPRAVGLLVQFSTAVSRKPANMAAVNPKIISWLCQEMLSSPGSPVMGSW